MSSNARQLGELATAGIGKNVIINGNFDIWQRGTSFTNALNQYTADRWFLSRIPAGPGNVDISRSTVVPDEGSEYSYFIDVAVNDASIASGDYYTVYHAVEGYNAQPLGFGGSNAKSLTLSFWVRSNVTGTYSVTFRNGATNRSYVEEYTINAADTWEYKSITIQGDTSGNWQKTTNTGLYINFSLAVGSTYSTTPGSWQAGNYIASNNQVNFMASTSNEIRFSRVQLEVGSTATEFERRQFEDELRLCQRYYEKSYNLGTDPGTDVTNATGNDERSIESLSYDTGNAIAGTTFKVRKRISPTITLYSNTGASGAVTGPNGQVNAIAVKPFETGWQWINRQSGNNFNLSSSNQNWFEYHYTADAEL